MSLTENKPLHYVRGEQSEYPQSAAVIYEGQMLGDASGYARQLVAGDPFIGHSAEYYDNSGGSAGDNNITRYRGRYRLQVTLSGVAITDVGKAVYASDAETLTLTGGANSRVGVVDRYVTTDTAIVEFQTCEESDANIFTSASFIWVSPDGSDTSGNGSFSNPYATVTKALTVVTAARKTVLLMPGTYTEALSLTWPSITGVSINGVLGHGDGATIVGTGGQTQVISIDPTVQTATFEATISNVTISCPDGVRGITFNNTNVGRKINLYLFNTPVENDTETDRAISVVHTTAGNAMRIYADGQKSIIEGLVYIEPKNADDRFTFTNFQFDGGIQFGTTTIASVSTFKDCIMKDAGGSGGQDTQILNVMGCYSLTGTTYAAAALGDFAANAAEVIL
jgi:hypothetical protein